MTIDETRVSFGSSGLVFGSRTVDHASIPLMTFAGQILTSGPNGMVVGGNPLRPGGAAVTVDGTVVSLGSSELVVGSSTTSFAFLPRTATTSRLSGQMDTISTSAPDEPSKSIATATSPAGNGGPNSSDGAAKMSFSLVGYWTAVIAARIICLV